MPHDRPENQPWFAAKTYGYGAGWPIAWQGWLALASYIAAMLGAALMAAASSNRGVSGVAIMLMVVLTGLFMLICKRRTRGGWRWRAGADD